MGRIRAGISKFDKNCKSTGLTKSTSRKQDKHTHAPKPIIIKLQKTTDEKKKNLKRSQGKKAMHFHLCWKKKDVYQSRGRNHTNNLKKEKI